MYFKLILDSGHVGAGNSIETVRYFRADDAVDMFTIAARVPRVKGKSTGSGVKMVQPVSREEYEKGVSRSMTDPYLGTRKRNRNRKRRKEVLFH